MEEGRLVSGLFMPNSNYFIDVKKCWIHEDGLERVRMDIMRVLNTHGCVSYNPHDKKVSAIWWFAALTIAISVQLLRAMMSLMNAWFLI